MDISRILQFLEQLQQNNNKAWMDMHKADYQEARNTLVQITEQLIQELGRVDQDIATLTPSQCIFRINRDIRFSKDKSPYKNNMGSYLAKGGKNGIYAGYYLHLQPHDQSFIAGGLYQPSPAVLKQVRQEIDYNGADLEAILSNKRFKELFGDLQGEKLQRPPKGYDAQHPYSEWLKLKSFIAIHPLSDKKATQVNLISYVVECFKGLVPFNRFLNQAIEEVKEEA